MCLHIVTAKHMRHARPARSVQGSVSDAGSLGRVGRRGGPARHALGAGLEQRDLLRNAGGKGQTECGAGGAPKGTSGSEQVHAPPHARSYGRRCKPGREPLFLSARAGSRKAVSLARLAAFASAESGRSASRNGSRNAGRS